MKPQDRLIVALDVDSEKRALELVNKLKGEVKFFKIGLELFSSCGPSIVTTVKKTASRVFLDLKLHDIPTTVGKAAASLVRLGADIINVHALGGHDMMKKTAEAVKEEAQRLKAIPPKVIAVTVLTSMDENNLKKIGINDTMESQVLNLARLAKDSGLDGVVASPAEAKLIREKIGKDFLIVTPGVRPVWASANDQKRIATPREALSNGADLIVIGRPIIEAPDPLQVARAILNEITSV
jgi:orotidine-5'-phosphate decarboxylase